MRRITSLVLIVLILVSTLIEISSMPIISEAQSNWLTGWEYRKRISLFSNVEEDNTVIEIKVYYNASIETGSGITCNANCKPDFSDIRFTDGDGVTLLSQVPVYKQEGEYAIFIVMVPHVSNVTNTIIYMYYGNPNANPYYNFDGFSVEDFESGTTGIFSSKHKSGNTAISVGTDVVHSGSYSLKIVDNGGTSSDYAYTDANVITGQKFFVSLWMYVDTNATRGASGVFVFTKTERFRVQVVADSGSATGYVFKMDDGSSVVAVATAEKQTWYNIIALVDNETKTWYVTIKLEDGSIVYAGSGSLLSINAIKALRLLSGGLWTGTTYYDDIVYAVPSSNVEITAVGQEEKENENGKYIVNALVCVHWGAYLRRIVHENLYPVGITMCFDPVDNQTVYISFLERILIWNDVLNKSGVYGESLHYKRVFNVYVDGVEVIRKVYRGRSAPDYYTTFLRFSDTYINHTIKVRYFEHGSDILGEDIEEYLTITPHLIYTHDNIANLSLDIEVTTASDTSIWQYAEGIGSGICYNEDVNLNVSGTSNLQIYTTDPTISLPPSSHNINVSSSLAVLFDFPYERWPVIIDVFVNNDTSAIANSFTGRLNITLVVNGAVLWPEPPSSSEDGSGGSGQEYGASFDTGSIGRYLVPLIIVAIGLVLSMFFRVLGLLSIVPALVYASRSGVSPLWLSVALVIGLVLLVYSRGVRGSE